jgi:hypothetical protein
MAPFLELVFVLATILLAAKLAGYLRTRFGQPSVLGELIVGLILGSTLVNLTPPILFVLHDNSCLDEILNAWEVTGASGITILPSTGLACLRQKSPLRDDLPLIPSLEDLVERVENASRTLFIIVKNEDMVDRIVAATQKITGDLILPNTGILVVLPVLHAYGLDRQD